MPSFLHVVARSQYIPAEALTGKAMTMNQRQNT